MSRKKNKKMECTINLLYVLFYVFIIVTAPGCTSTQSADHSNKLLYKPGNTTLYHESGETLIAPNFALSYYNNGIEEYNRGNYSSAIDHYNKAIEKTENYKTQYHIFYSYLHYHRGIAHYKNREYDLAFNDCNSAIKMHSQNALAFFGRGLVYRIRSEYSNAIRDFTRVIQIKPDATPAYIARAMSYAAYKHQYQKAIQDLQTAVSLSPSSTIPYYTLAKIYSKTGNKTESIFCLEKVVALALKNPSEKRRIREVLESESDDFVAINKTEAYKALMEKLKQN